MIRRSAEHLTNLVEGLLDISRVESGVLKFRQDVVRLPAFLDQLVDMFRMQAAAKGFVDYIVEGRRCRLVRTDEKRLRQILINLLSNAIKLPIEAVQSLTVRYRSQMALIEVGIPASASRPRTWSGSSNRSSAARPMPRCSPASDSGWQSCACLPV